MKNSQTTFFKILSKIKNEKKIWMFVFKLIILLGFSVVMSGVHDESLELWGNIFFVMGIFFYQFSFISWKKPLRIVCVLMIICRTGTSFCYFNLIFLSILVANYSASQPLWLLHYQRHKPKSMNLELTMRVKLLSSINDQGESDCDFVTSLFIGVAIFEIKKSEKENILRIFLLLYLNFSYYYTLIKIPHHLFYSSSPIVAPSTKKT